MSAELPHAGAESDDLIGQTLANRYQIEHRLGEGAMGTVYKARHVKVGRPFAVKVLHSRLLIDSKVLQRFEREAELAGRLHHPNVIGVVDVGEASGMRYMVMDFAEGPDLATLMTEAPMVPERVIHLVRQLLEGLYHAHEQGLIHRDFKPENVIIERDAHGDEVPRIVDFGIAILREGGDSSDGQGRLTTNGLVLGTPHYMAPEQAVADPIDHRIDLFALGIMIYEMLSGVLPFDGTGAEVARANLLLEPPPIAVRVPHLAVDPLLEAFARRLMAKKRSMRPPTAKAARDLLDLIVDDRVAAANALGVPIEAVRPSQPTQPVAPLRDHAHPGTFPPPLRAPAPTPPATPIAIGEHAFTTDPIVHALSARKRRGPLIGAAVGGLAVLGIAAGVMMHGSNDKAATKPALPIVSAIEAPADAAVGPVAPVVPVVVMAQPDAQTAALADPEPTPPVKPKAVINPQPKPTKRVVATADTRPVIKPESKPESKPDPRPDPVVAEAKPVDVPALVSQFQSVGSELKALEQTKGADVASDLQARYRLIMISDAMSSQPKRDAAMAILVKLHREIAVRKTR